MRPSFREHFHPSDLIVGTDFVPTRRATSDQFRRRNVDSQIRRGIRRESARASHDSRYTPYTHSRRIAYPREIAVLARRERGVHEEAARRRRDIVTLTHTRVDVRCACEWSARAYTHSRVQRRERKKEARLAPFFLFCLFILFLFYIPVPRVDPRSFSSVVIDEVHLPVKVLGDVPPFRKRYLSIPSSWHISMRSRSIQNLSLSISVRSTGAYLCARAHAPRAAYTRASRLGQRENWREGDGK